MEIYQYLWSFGDGYTSNEAAPTHSYLRAGVYTVTLTIYTDLGTFTTTTTVTVADSAVVEVENFCLRLAVEQPQGVEWSECSGPAWLTPVASVLIIDDNGVPRMLIEDEDGSLWEDSTYDRIQFRKPSFVDKYREESLVSSDYRWTLSGSGTAEYYLEKYSGGDPGLEEPKEMETGGLSSPQGTIGALQAGFWGYGDNDTLGYDTVYIRLPDSTDPDTKDEGYVEGHFWTEITTETWYGEDVSDPRAEENIQEISELHWYTRPYEPENKGADGYDDNGYRTAQKFSLDLYKDGALTRPFAQVEDIPENGDILFSGIKIQGRRFQPVFKTDASEFMIVGRNLFKTIKALQGDQVEQSNSRIVADNALSTPTFFIGRDRLNPLMNRVTGIVVPGSVGSAIGPDGNDGSAIVIPAAGLILSNAAIVGAYTFMFWRSTTAPVSTTPALPALIQSGVTVNGWQLMYVYGTGCPASIVITQGTVSTIRLYSADIRSYLSLYYNSMIYDLEPKPFEPGL